jgi:hypothetical protein
MSLFTQLTQTNKFSPQAAIACSLPEQCLLTQNCWCKVYGVIKYSRELSAWPIETKLRGAASDLIITLNGIFASPQLLANDG